MELAEKVHQLTVNGGAGTAGYESGDTVTIAADDPPEGKTFVNWTVVSGGIKLADAANKTTTFIMPDTDAEVTANYVESGIERNIGVQYQTHIQDISWETAGTSALGLRLEGIRIKLVKTE